MNTTNVTVGSTKDTSKLQRARFRPGMLLEHEDLDLLNTYTRDLSRLLFGSLFGCGVICGLVVKAQTNCDRLQVTVGAGVALACSGDPIQVTKDQVFFMNEDYRPPQNARLWVELCATKKCCAPRTAICSSDDEETTSECSRERDGFEIKVVTERPPCVCGCPEPLTNQTTLSNDQSKMQNQQAKQINASKLFGATSTMDCECADPESDCYKDHYDGICGCHCDDCSDCDCKCILLARLDRDGDTDTWKVDHRVRRFIRPVLIRDPQVYLEQHPVVYSTLQTGQTVQLINDAAYAAAQVVLQKEAEKSAQQATRQVAQQAANELGQRVAEVVWRPIVEEAARQAAEEAMKKQAEQKAALDAEIEAKRKSAEQASQLEAEQQAQDMEGESSTKSTKSSKSGKSGLPPRQ
jgi:hypothetical protein